MIPDQDKQAIATAIHKLNDVFDWDKRQRNITEAEEAQLIRTLNAYIVQYGAAILDKIISSKGILIHPALSEGLDGVKDDLVQTLFPVWARGKTRLAGEQQQKAIALLREQLEKNNPPFWALNTLQQFHAPELFETLIAAYRRTYNAGTKNKIKQAIGTIDLPEARYFLANTYPTEASIQAIANRNDQEALDTLSVILKTSNEEAIKRRCLYYLPSLKTVNPQQILMILRDVILNRAESPAIRTYAQSQLSAWGGGLHAVTAMIEACEQVEDEEIRTKLYLDICYNNRLETAVVWMKQQLDTLAAQPLERETLKRFIGLVGAVGEARHLPLLEQLARFPESAYEQRKNAIAAIGVVGGESALAVLSRLERQTTQGDEWNRIPEAISHARHAARAGDKG